MRRSIRCAHGFDRTQVPCEQCGDKWDRLPEGAKMRKPVTDPTVGRKVPKSYKGKT